MTYPVTLDIPPSLPDTIDSLALGIYDGFHRAHQLITKNANALLTCHPHPEIVLKKHSDLQYLSTISELRQLFPSTIVLNFTPDIAGMDPLDFLNKIILDRFSPKHIYCGHDYRFGAKQAGDVALLTRWGAQHGIHVSASPEITHRGKTVRSGAIRKLLDEGHFDDAIDLLGHPYLIHGRVVKGDGRGKSLGFPTINIDVPDRKYIPQHGVYKADILLNNTALPTIVYIGTKPTFSPSTKTIEAHILEWDGNLYGQDIQLNLYSFIRGEMSFESPRDLINQIKTDIRTHFHD
ncbi:riboflavin biosynthesis protein RibF [Candidatus Marinamargulisbacteria bacterium SCGC AG-343-D04]|nr:riboflavin biosynthesis protein RibF [Candidatus Marinamargulisbacteria bacterium SCGC AG-343-D04]